VAQAGGAGAWQAPYACMSERMPDRGGSAYRRGRWGHRFREFCTEPHTDMFTEDRDVESQDVHSSTRQEAEREEGTEGAGVRGEATIIRVSGMGLLSQEPPLFRTGTICPVQVLPPPWSPPGLHHAFSVVLPFVGVHFSAFGDQ
jgi:hypothetical protein